MSTAWRSFVHGSWWLQQLALDLLDPASYPPHTHTPPPAALYLLLNAGTRLCQRPGPLTYRADGGGGGGAIALITCALSYLLHHPFMLPPSPWSPPPNAGTRLCQRPGPLTYRAAGGGSGGAGAEAGPLDQRQGGQERPRPLPPACPHLGFRVDRGLSPEGRALPR